MLKSSFSFAVALFVGTHATLAQTPATTLPGPGTTLPGARSQAPVATTPGAAAPKLVPRGPGDVAPPEHPATPEQIKEYLQLTKSVENAHRAFGQMVDNSKRQAPPYFPADFWVDVDHSFTSIDIASELTPIYQRYFSQEDMAAALAFYKTPAGQRVLSEQPLAAVASSDVLRKDGQRVGQEALARHKDEIDAAQKAAQGGAAGPSAAPAKPTLSSPGDKPAAPQKQNQK